MRNTALLTATFGTLALTASSFATVSSTLVADTYVVKDGSRFYSVLDVYVKGSAQGDVMAGVFGTTNHSLVVATNRAQGVSRDSSGRVISGQVTSDIFAQAGNSSWLPSYAGSGSGANWDSFVANGNRTQGASVTNRAGATVAIGTNGVWFGGEDDSSSSLRTANANYLSSGPGYGWGTTIGSNPYATAGAVENPFARVSLYNSAWNSTYYDLDRSRLVSVGALRNGAASAGSAWANRINPLAGPIAGGASLDFHWMVGRFAVETTGMSSTEEITLNVQFTMIGRHGTTSDSGTVFGGTLDGQSQFNVSQFFAFAVPAPGAAALLGLAGLMRRRRSI